MTKTETAITKHGEVEYEVVKCDCCGQECKKDNAKDFVVGSVYGDNITPELRGNACPNCVEDGPITVPGRTQTKTLTLSKEEVIVGIGLWFLTALACGMLL